MESTNTTFYKFLKLSNGEDIIVTTAEDCKDFRQKKLVFVRDAVKIQSIRAVRGPYVVESFSMQPWIKVAKEGIIEIPSESIVVAVDVDERVITQYRGFIKEYNQAETAVEEAEHMEEIVEELFGTEESDEINEAINELKKERNIH